MIVQSQNGTGKTCVFAVSSLQVVDEDVRSPQALILSPTRELADQTGKICQALGDYMNCNIHICTGGKSVQEDEFRLDHGVHVISGTPGRVYDMIQRRKLKTSKIKLLVLDEADEMLTKGFKAQVYDIYRELDNPQNI